MLLIIDNQSSFIKRFKRNYLSEIGIEYIFFDHNQPIILSNKAKVSGIILSGGRGNPYEPLNLTADFIALMNFDVPVLGFCLGHEILAVAFRGRIKKLPLYQRKRQIVQITKPEDPIFEGLDKMEVSLQKQHQFHVSDLPESFISLAESEITPNEIIRHKTKPIYGFQAHPEVSGPDGLLMVRNFLKICGFTDV